MTHFNTSKSSYASLNPELVGSYKQALKGERSIAFDRPKFDVAIKKKIQGWIKNALKG
jgi:hypothetical protein